MKKSKIIRIESMKPFTNTHGTVIYHNLEMYNGDKINIGKKSEQQVGWELIYKIVDSGQEYNKAKYVSKEDFDNSNAPNLPNISPEQKNNISKPLKNNINNDVQLSILYQSTMKEVMNYFAANGFEDVESDTDTVQQKMDIVSDVCLYLSEKSKKNIIKLIN